MPSVNGERLVIVNADDFGLSDGVNDGILEAHERGVVTSTSLMVRPAAAPAAVAAARRHPRLSLGLHVDLGEWAFRAGEWIALYQRVDLRDAAGIDEEVRRQLATFRALTGQRPTHVDSHQHVHLREPVRSVMSALATEVGVPLRHVSPGVTYCGRFYGQTENGTPLPNAIGAQTLRAIFESLSPGVTEIACHPGYADELDTMYRSERRTELRALCDPDVRESLTALGIRLVSFRDLDRHARA